MPIERLTLETSVAEQRLQDLRDILRTEPDLSAAQSNDLRWCIAFAEARFCNFANAFPRS